MDASIKPSDTILKVKQLVCKVASIPVAAQRLIFCGQVLPDWQTIRATKIQPGSVVQVIVKEDALGTQEKSPSDNAAAASSASAPSSSASPAAATSSSLSPAASVTLVPSATTPVSGGAVAPQ